MARLHCVDLIEQQSIHNLVIAKHHQVPLLLPALRVLFGHPIQTRENDSLHDCVNVQSPFRVSQELQYENEYYDNFGTPSPIVYFVIKTKSILNESSKTDSYHSDR